MMTTTNKLALFIIAGLCVLIVTLIYMTKKLNDDHKQLQGLLRDTTRYFEVKHNKDSSIVVTQLQTVATLQNAIDAGLIREEQLKNLNLKYLDMISNMSADVTFKNLVAKYVEKQPMNNGIANYIPSPQPKDTNIIKVPNAFEFRDKWILLTGIVRKQDIKFDSIHIPMNFTFAMGYRKPSFFKKLKPVITISSDNPYVNIIKLNNVVIKEQPPFYKKWWFHFLGGVAATVVAFHYIK